MNQNIFDSFDKLGNVYKESLNYDRYILIPETENLSDEILNVATSDRDKMIEILNRFYKDNCQTSEGIDDFVTLFGAYCNYYILYGMHLILKEEDFGTSKIFENISDDSLKDYLSLIRLGIYNQDNAIFEKAVEENEEYSLAHCYLFLYYLHECWNNSESGSAYEAKLIDNYRAIRNDELKKYTLGNSKFIPSNIDRYCMQLPLHTTSLFFCPEEIPKINNLPPLPFPLPVTPETQRRYGYLMLLSGLYMHIENLKKKFNILKDINYSSEFFYILKNRKDWNDDEKALSDFCEKYNVSEEVSSVARYIFFGFPDFFNKIGDAFKELLEENFTSLNLDTLEAIKDVDKNIAKSELNSAKISLDKCQEKNNKMLNEFNDLKIVKITTESGEILELDLAKFDEEISKIMSNSKNTLENINKNKIEYTNKIIKDGNEKIERFYNLKFKVDSNLMIERLIFLKIFYEIEWKSQDIFNFVKRIELKNEKDTMVRDFMHTYSNMKADDLYDIAQLLLKRDSIEDKATGRRLLLEYALKKEISNSVYTMQLMYKNSIDDLKKMIRRSLVTEEDDFENVSDIFNKALRQCFINVFYVVGESDDNRGKMRKNLRRFFGEDFFKIKRDQFEQQFMEQDFNCLEWISQEGIKFTYKQDAAWGKIFMEKEGFTSAFLKIIFDELCVNVFKYGDLKQEISLELSENEDKDLVICFVNRFTRTRQAGGTKNGINLLKRRIKILHKNADKNCVEVVDDEKAKIFKIKLIFPSKLFLE